MYVPSSELGLPHPPLPQSSVASPPPPGTKGEGEAHSPAGEGVGSPNSDDWRKSLAPCHLCGFHQFYMFSVSGFFRYTEINYSITLSVCIKSIKKTTKICTFIIVLFTDCHKQRFERLGCWLGTCLVQAWRQPRVGSGCADHGLQLQVRVLETGGLGDVPHSQSKG